MAFLRFARHLRQPVSWCRVSAAVASALALAACSTGARGRAVEQSHSAGVETSAVPAPGSGGVVHLTAYTDNDGPTSTVVVTGAVGDFGKAVRSAPSGAVSSGRSDDLELRLSSGTFRIDVEKLDTAFIASMKHLATNKVTCSGTATVAGAAPIVSGSGTRRYAGIAGTFALRITLDEVYTRPACTEASTYRAQVIVIAGSGNVSFRSG
jgi:hypothetical protein